VSTHVLREVERIANRILIINQGKLVADGSLEELGKRAETGAAVTCHIDGSGVEEALKGISGIKSVRYERGGRGENRFFVSAEGDPKHLAEHVFTLARDKGWMLYELHQEKSGIEEIFRELTK